MHSFLYSIFSVLTDLQVAKQANVSSFRLQATVKRFKIEIGANSLASHWGSFCRN